MHYAHICVYTCVHYTYTHTTNTKTKCFKQRVAVAYAILIQSSKI